MSTKFVSGVNFQNSVQKRSQLGDCHSQNYCYLSFRDVNFFGARLLPSELRPCQATCSQTNLEELKDRKEHDLNKKTFLEKFSFKISQQKAPADLFFKLSHLNFKIKLFSELVLTYFLSRRYVLKPIFILSRKHFPTLQIRLAFEKNIVFPRDSESASSVKLHLELQQGSLKALQM